MNYIRIIGSEFRFINDELFTINPATDFYISDASYLDFFNEQSTAFSSFTGVTAPREAYVLSSFTAGSSWTNYLGVRTYTPPTPQGQTVTVINESSGNYTLVYDQIQILDSVSSSGDAIVLPTGMAANELYTITVYFQTPATSTTITMPSNVFWSKALPSPYPASTNFKLILTYLNGIWLGDLISYSY